MQSRILTTPLPRRAPGRRGDGFTLVELLVVITIIGTLAAISIPVIRGVVKRANDTATRMEIEAIERAAHAYEAKYGDLPPDGSSWVVIQRHFNRCFARISGVDSSLLYNMCHAGGVFQPTAIDRARCMVLFLGGLSSDETRPLTGPGGPLQYVGPANGDRTLPANYQYNIDRQNRMMEFEMNRLTLAQLPDPTSPPGPGNRVLSLDGTLIPKYVPAGKTTPYVYFDSRTYGFIPDSTIANPVYNGYAHTSDNVIRPYKTLANAPGGGSFTNATVAEALRWHNPDTFQIIAAGQDDHFGNIGQNPDNNAMPAYFVTESGQLMACNPSATSGPAMLHPTISQFQERSINSSWENTHLDNLSNFNDGRQLRMEDNLQL